MICAVYSCSSGSKPENCQSFKFFRFPKGKFTLKKWLLACKRGDKVRYSLHRLLATTLLHFLLTATRKLQNHISSKKTSCLLSRSYSSFIHSKVSPLSICFTHNAPRNDVTHVNWFTLSPLLQAKGHFFKVNLSFGNRFSGFEPLEQPYTAQITIFA